MSWKQIPAGRRRSSVGVAMALRFGAGGAQSKKRMIFVYLGEDVVEKLQWDGDTRVAVYLGDGEHAAKLRIAQAVGGDAMKLRSVGGNAKYAKLGVIFPPPPNVADETHGSRPVEYEIRADGIEVVLPAWARTEATLPPVLRPQPQIKPAPVMRDVTSALMGDPQPGRSAADQRRVKGAS